MRVSWTPGLRCAELPAGGLWGAWGAGGGELAPRLPAGAVRGAARSPEETPVLADLELG